MLSSLDFEVECVAIYIWDTQSSQQYGRFANAKLPLTTPQPTTESQERSLQLAGLEVIHQEKKEGVYETLEFGSPEAIGIPVVEFVQSRIL